MAYALFSSQSIIPLQLNHGMRHARITNLPNITLYAKTDNSISRDGKSINYLMRKAKASVEADLLSKDYVSVDADDGVGLVGVHHVGILCQNLEKSVDFYQNILGLKINEARPHDKLPYRGAWFWVGSEMIHLMELPNPDPVIGRPEHAGRDRHTCMAICDVSVLKAIFDKAGIRYTLSRSGRPAIFTHDPDGNGLEFMQVD